MNKRGLLVVYSGPSGVGKGTLLAPLIGEHGPLTLSVSATTRPPRPGEIDGVHYLFVTKERFEGMIAHGEMLEYAYYNGNYYGTPRSFVNAQLSAGRNVVLEIEVQGAVQVRSQRSDALMVFVMPPSFEELRRRLLGRGTETEEQMNNRLATALSEIAHATEYDYIIVNDEIERARAELLEAIQAGRLLSRYHTKLINEVLKRC